MIIGITGYKRAGKDTVADMLVEMIGNAKKLPLVAPMKEVAKLVFGWTDEWMDAHKEEADPQYGISPRLFLQLFGTDFAQMMLSDKAPAYKKITDRSLWVKRWLATTSDKNIRIISDIRFPHEVHTLTEESGDQVYIIRVVRPGTGPSEHSSEKEMEKIVPTVTILNDSSIFALKQKVTAVLRELPKRNLPKVYLSGPMTGMPNANRQAFAIAKQFVSERYPFYEVINPHDLHLEAYTQPWEVFMRDDIAQLCQCAAIYMLAGWKGSTGACLELDVAKSLGIHVLGAEL